MGQKTNPTILRLGKLAEWESKYIEKKSSESSVLVFRDLEIRKFIFQLFAKNKLKVQNYKTYFSNNSLHIYIAYCNVTKFPQWTDKVKVQPKKHKSKIFKAKVANLKNSVIKKKLYLEKTYEKVLNEKLKKKYSKSSYLLKKKTQRLDVIKNFQKYVDGKKYVTLNTQNKNLFISKLFKSLSLFLNKKYDIFLNLKQINQETALLQKISKKTSYKVKKNLTKLRKFQQTEFFKKGFNLLYSFITNKQSSLFLAEFIALFLRKLKRPNFFLRFLKLTLKTLLIQKFSQFKRIQVKIKGRFNGAPRASHKFINIGKNIPILTLNSKIDYGEAVSYTSNGTFGVKVWTYSLLNKSHHV